uniref:Protein kinase domain-containing protein n=2 Tax=Meloidogyne TaxID=189290 RepID=A0A915LKT8_MELJA
MHASPPNYAQNQPGVVNKLIVTGGTTKYSITLKEGNNKCTAPNNGQEIECQLSGKKLTGELIFTFSNRMEIVVPFKEVPFFAGNKCQINLVDYNRGTHETIIEINGVKVKIVLDEENKIPIQALVNSGCVQCTGRGGQQTNSPPHFAETSQQTDIGASSSTQRQLEEIEYVDGHRLVRIPLIDYIRGSRTRNFGILVNFATYNLMRDEKLILMEIILSTNTFLANNALEIFKHFAKEKSNRNGGHLYNRIICMLGHNIIPQNVQGMLLEGGSQTLENYFLNMHDRSPSNMKNLLYQMALAVEQFHDGSALHLNINPSNFICDNENGSNECIVKLIPGVNSTLSTRNTKNLNWTYGSEIYKSPEYRSNQNNDYTVSQKSDVYSLCLVAFEFVLRSANSERFLLIDSHFNTQLVVDSLIINLLSTNYDIRQLIDEVEGWIWRNDLIMTLKYCLNPRHDHPDIVHLLSHWNPASPPPEPTFFDEDYLNTRLK